MAEGKNVIIVYRDWISTFDSLTDEEAGRLIKHFFRYINDLNPDDPDRLTGLLFEPIKQTLKRDLKKYEAICLKNRDNVNIRWNKNDTTVYDRIRTDTKHTDRDRDKDRDKDKDRDSINYSGIVENYHALCPKMNKVQVLNDTRKGYINARLAEFGEPKVIEVIRIAGQSDFLNGKNDKAWKADFDWIMRPNNFIKIMEGKFNNKQKHELTEDDFKD